MADEGIHIVGVDVESLQRLRVAHVRLLPGGRLIRVTGKNGAGKTSLLRAIRVALGGKGEVLPAVIHDEEEKGSVRLELSNGFTITRNFTATNMKGYLKVIGPDGGAHKQAKINGWLGENHDFDVLAFYGLSPQRQREILLSSTGDPDLLARVTALRADQARIYDERTPHISLQRHALGVPRPEGERPEPVDVTAQMERRRELQAMQDKREEAERSLRELGRSIKSKVDDEEDVQVRIRRLEEQLAEKRKQLKALTDVRREMQSTYELLKKDLDATPRVDDEIAAVEEVILTANEVNEKLAPWREWEKAKREAADERAIVDALTKELQAKRDEELKLLSEADFPVPDLSFDEETGAPRLKGRPLEVASGAERINLAVALALRADPELRICLVDEANDLDQDALEALDALAKEHDFQILGCRIGIEGPGEILVDAGEARTPE